MLAEGDDNQLGLGGPGRFQQIVPGGVTVVGLEAKTAQHPDILFVMIASDRFGAG